MGDLTKNFDSIEMKCNCGCGICIVDSGFILKLQAARSFAGIPFTVMSGCRCLTCNKKESRFEESDHLTTADIACEGADIYCGNSSDRYKIISAAFQAGFKRIGIHEGFIHLGTAKRNPQEVLWIYQYLPLNSK